VWCVQYTVVVTGDHSTPVFTGDHSYESVPFVIAPLPLLPKRILASTYPVGAPNGLTELLRLDTTDHFSEIAMMGLGGHNASTHVSDTRFATELPQDSSLRPRGGVLGRFCGRDVMRIIKTVLKLRSEP